MREEDNGHTAFGAVLITIFSVLFVVLAYHIGKEQQRLDTVTDCAHLGKFRSNGKTFECKEAYK